MYKLGEKVVVKAVTKSVKTWDSNNRRNFRKIITEPLEEPLIGCVVGVRVLKEGHTETGYDYNEFGGGYYNTFKQTGYKKVYLIAVNLSKTIKALPEDIIIPCKIGEIDGYISINKEEKSWS